MTSGPKEKVAILGGGLGAISAAWHLTDPALNGRYEVTVHQMGWRLGGKAASGRNRDHGDRIEEHGLHMMMGWYAHTLSMMRNCYDEWTPPAGSPITTFDGAFVPQRAITLPTNTGTDGNDDWRFLTINLPRLPGEPGDVPTDLNPLDLLVSLIAALRHPAERLGLAIPAAQDDSVWHGHSLARSLHDLWEPLDLLHELERLLAAAVAWVEEKLDDLDHDLRALWVFLRLGIAMAKGLLLDVLPYGSDGWDRINHLDLKDWLASHGAETPEVSFSAPVRAFYDLTFAYPGGDGTDWRNASLAAGVALKTMLRTAFTYKDAPLFKMTAGMGDIILSPLYQVLRARGVRFEFFHRVTDLHLTPDHASIGSIEISQQADTVHGSYEPLYDTGGMQTWPSTPMWDQLVDGAKLQSEGVNFESAWCDRSVGTLNLEMGRDYDHVVLGISLGGLEGITRELTLASDRWANMLTIPTVMTRAAQVWTTPDLEGLGWHAGPSVCAGYVPPFDSFADMSQVIAAEEWTGTPPGSVQYLCSPLWPGMDDPYKDPTYPERMLGQVEQQARSWLDDAAGLVFPDAVDANGRFKDDVLYADGPGDPLAQQYFRANIDPSERYVLTPPGTIDHRLAPGDPVFTNLYPAGDWVKTSINGGSAEAAVEGGMLAARAIRGDDG